MKKRVLCIGDSLSLPRENVCYEHTWFSLIKDDFPNLEFVDYFKRGLTIDMTESLFLSYYQFYCPSVVIWESGLVDCAPRIINTTKLSWMILLKLSKLLHFEDIFWKIVKSIFHRTSNCVFTPIKEFEYYSEKLIQNFINIGVDKIIILKIEKLGSIADRKSKFWMNNICKYNDVFEKLQTKYKDNVILISPKDNATDDCYIEDGYHCNAKGMQMTRDGIKDVLNHIYSQN